jgi:ABC-type phosphate transport system auxiliary subunit
VVTLLKNQLDSMHLDNRAMRLENEGMRCEMEALRKENAELRDVQQRHAQQIVELQALVEQFEQVLIGAHLLYDQVVEAKIEPKYKPPERRRK